MIEKLIGVGVFCFEFVLLRLGLFVLSYFVLFAFLRLLRFVIATFPFQLAVPQDHLTAETIDVQTLLAGELLGCCCTFSRLKLSKNKELELG